MSEAIIIDKTMLNWMLEYILEMENRCEHEWGSCKSIEELENNNLLPQEYYKLKELNTGANE